MPGDIQIWLSRSHFDSLLFFCRRKTVGKLLSLKSIYISCSPCALFPVPVATVLEWYCSWMLTPHISYTWGKMIKEQQTTLAVSSYLKSEVLHLQLRKSKLALQRFLHSQEIEKQARGSHWGFIPPTVLSLCSEGWLGQKGSCMSHSPAVPCPSPDT